MSLATKFIDQNIAKTIAIRACGDDESVKVVDYHLEDFSKSKVGFLGNHQRLEIKVKQAKGELVKLLFFVKSMPDDSDEHVTCLKHRYIFNQESQFFNEVMPHMLEVTAGGKIEPWAPTSYFASSDFIVLEDVTNSGFTMSETKVFEGENLKSVLKAMARFHAASILLESKAGKPLNELYPGACVEQLFNKTLLEYGAGLFESLIYDVAKRNKRTPTRLHDNVKYVFNYLINKSEDKKNQVLCHGDAWPNNFMLDLTEPPKCILVDYQMVRYAPRTIDVAQLIYLSTTRKVRKYEESAAIETYWEELSETLRKCNPSIERPSLETLKEEYDDDVKLVAQLTAIIYFPTVLLNKEVLLEYQDNPEELYAKFIFRRNNDHVLELMDKDEDYASRITEIVMEFLDNCEKPRSFET